MPIIHTGKLSIITEDDRIIPDSAGGDFML